MKHHPPNTMNHWFYCSHLVLQTVPNAEDPTPHPANVCLPQQDFNGYGIWKIDSISLYSCCNNSLTIETTPHFCLICQASVQQLLLYNSTPEKNPKLFTLVSPWHLVFYCPDSIYIFQYDEEHFFSPPLGYLAVKSENRGGTVLAKYWDWEFLRSLVLAECLAEWPHSETTASGDYKSKSNPTPSANWNYRLVLRKWNSF